MKRMAIVVVLVLTMLALCGCVGQMSRKEVAQESDNDRLFMQVSCENYGRVIVDKATRVMYWESYWAYNYGTLTVLVNRDGTPRIWEG